MRLAGNKSVEGCRFGECILIPFSEKYNQIHFVLSMTICVFGTVANSLNIVVLTRRCMRTATTIILTGLSVAQLALIACFSTYLCMGALMEHCFSTPWSLAGSWYRYIAVNLNVMFHTVAFAHTLLLAFYRYSAIRWPAFMMGRLKVRVASKDVAMLWICVPFVCLPVIFSSKVSRLEENDKPANCRLDKMYDLSYTQHSNWSFWLFGIGFKLLPSAALVLLIWRLVANMRQADRRRQSAFSNAARKSGGSATVLVNPDAAVDAAPPPPPANRAAAAARVQAPLLQRRDSCCKTFRTLAKPRTTRMLIAIAVLCAAVEGPHGIVNLLTAIYGHEDFGQRVYNHIGNVIEMLTLLYSSVNFLLYCTMSSDFLETFGQLFCPRALAERMRRSSSCTTWNPHTPAMAARRRSSTLQRRAKSLSAMKTPNLFVAQLGTIEEASDWSVLARRRSVSHEVISVDNEHLDQML